MRPVAKRRKRDRASPHPIPSVIRPARFDDVSIVSYALVQSESDPTKCYFVAKHQSGRITCNCPAATYSRLGRLCKHAKEAVDRNLFQEI